MGKMYDVLIYTAHALIHGSKIRLTKNKKSAGRGSVKNTSSLRIASSLSFMRAVVVSRSSVNSCSCARFCCLQVVQLRVIKD